MCLLPRELPAPLWAVLSLRCVCLSLSLVCVCVCLSVSLPVCPSACGCVDVRVCLPVVFPEPGVGPGWTHGCDCCRLSGAFGKCEHMLGRGRSRGGSALRVVRWFLRLLCGIQLDV